MSWLWAAGLFEGEGCITFSTRKAGSKQWALRLVSTDRDVVRKFQQAVGCGSVRPRKEVLRKPHWKRAYCWETSKIADVGRVLQKLVPHFGRRRRGRAGECLRDLARKRDRQGEKLWTPS